MPDLDRVMFIASHKYAGFRFLLSSASPRLATATANDEKLKLHSST